jgi:hypothetical protein
MGEYQLPASFSPQKREELFEQIVELYDLADGIMEAVAQDGVKNRSVQLDLAKPFVTQIVNSANVLSAFYTEVVRNGRAITPELQDTFETAFRNIFYAFRDFLDGAEEKLLPKEKL